MSLPANLAEMLDEGDFPTRGGFFAADDNLCEGAKFHSPTPLVLKVVSLNPYYLSADTPGGVEGKREVDAGTVVLCGTCADNLGVLQDLLIRHNGSLPWKVRREFGNQIRIMAERGWALTEEADV